MNKVKTAVVAVCIVASLSLTTSAFAQQPSNVLPGWGYGDPIHIHVGPPGRSIIIDPPYDGEQIRTKIRAFIQELLSNLPFWQMGR